MVRAMILLMGIMFFVATTIAFLSPVPTLGFVSKTDGKAKRHFFVLSNDGELRSTSVLSPILYKVMVTNPAYLAATWNKIKAVMHQAGQPDKMTRDIVAITVSMMRQLSKSWRWWISLAALID